MIIFDRRVVLSACSSVSFVVKRECLNVSVCFGLLLLHMLLWSRVCKANNLQTCIKYPKCKYKYKYLLFLIKYNPSTGAWTVGGDQWHTSRPIDWVLQHGTSS